MQQKSDDMVGSEQRARHRRLEFVGHPARGVRIEFGGRVDEAARAAAPIDESLNEAYRKQSERSAVQRVCPAEQGSGWMGGGSRTVFDLGERNRCETNGARKRCHDLTRCYLA